MIVVDAQEKHEKKLCKNGQQRSIYNKSNGFCENGTTTTVKNVITEKCAGTSRCFEHAAKDTYTQVHNSNGALLLICQRKGIAVVWRGCLVDKARTAVSWPGCMPTIHLSAATQRLRTITYVHLFEKTAAASTETREVGGCRMDLQWSMRWAECS